MVPSNKGSLVMSDGPAAALFQPGRIGTMQLRNRFVQAPIFTQFASTFGEADDKLIEYHRARARGGVLFRSRVWIQPETFTRT
jgi:2,4-dienoyl-CoA reductase-like NADH-dependent reductase (Old Yellow Enzyme family)